MLRRILFSDKVFPVITRSMDAYATRQRAIASNMANIATPGYQRMKVPFEDDLRDALNTSGRMRGARDDSAHLPLGRSTVDELRPRIERADDRKLASGVNNVDIDREMAELADTNIRYQTMTHYMKTKIGMLRNSINGRPGG
ncbi:MAG: flagellar basal body rod protein FlgB [Gemmatimonadetes bacterium]|nr:flagellar basal body rod protein FlgB [Gemmatimonadota bacterium]